MQANAQIAPQEAEVEIRAVHDDLDFGVLEGRSQEGRGVERQRVDHVRVLLGGELDQAEPVRIPMEARRLTVQSDAARRPELLLEGVRVLQGLYMHV